MGINSRRLAIQKACEYLAVRPVFLDTETTGLDLRSEIVEICILDYDGSILLNTLVKPVSEIPLDAMRVHGITSEMVRYAPDWPEVWSGVEAILRTRYIGIYNANFDLKMMRQSHQRHGLVWDFSSGRVFDVMKLYADFSGSARWVSLDVAGRQCGIALPNAHRAHADTLLLKALLEYMAGRFSM